MVMALTIKVERHMADSQAIERERQCILESAFQGTGMADLWQPKGKLPSQKIE